MKKGKIKVWESKDAEGRKIYQANRSQINQPSFMGAVYSKKQAIINLKEIEKKISI